MSGALVSLVLASPIRAQDAGQKLDIQLLPPIQGKSYDMPTGDFSAEVKAEAAARLRLVPRRTLNPDQLRQIKAGPGAPATSDRAAAAGNQAQANAVTLKCATNSSTNFAPSDIHGAVTPNRLVVVTNVQVGVYNKADCSQVSLKGLRGFFRAAFTIPDTQTLFDPQVIYDESSQRCFLSAESEDSGNTDQYQYFAV